MMRSLGLLVLILLFLLALYHSKKSAKKRCAELLSRIENDPEQFGRMAAAAVEGKSLKTLDDFINAKEKAFLIVKDQSLTVYSLNNNRRQTILPSQCDKLERRLECQNPAYTYSFESYSIYYRLPEPNQNAILRIDAQA